MIHSIIKARPSKSAKPEYFWAVNGIHLSGMILTLVETGWTFIESRHLVNHDDQLESMIRSETIGSDQEQACLKILFRKQKNR